MRRLLILALLTLPASLAMAQTRGPWLFAGFKNNGEDGVYFALSRDGYHWHLIHHAQPLILPTQSNELMRDPFLQRGPDGTFRMLWTWSWRLPAVLGYSTSTDLIHWTPHRQLDVLANEPAAANAWAPALYWQPGQQNWLVLWTTWIPNRFPGPQTEPSGQDHRIFSATTIDFNTFSPARVYFDPGYSVIDATLLAGHPNTLVFKDEREIPLEKHIQIASRANDTAPWSTPSAAFTEPWSEGPASITVPGGTIVYYDHYRPPQHYAAAFSSDLRVWTDITSRIEFPAGLRHGSFLSITQAEYKRLEALQ